MNSLTHTLTGCSAVELSAPPSSVEWPLLQTTEAPRIGKPAPLVVLLMMMMMAVYCTTKKL
jgi:hypothetical protein